MKCDHATELTAFLQGEGTPEERAALRRHLDGCGACAQEAEQLGRALGALGRLEGVEPPPDFAERVTAAALRAHPGFGRRAGGASRRGLRLAAIAAGGLLALSGAAAVVHLRDRRPDHPKMGHLAPPEPGGLAPESADLPRTPLPPRVDAAAWDQALAYDRRLVQGTRPGSEEDAAALARAVGWLIQRQDPDGSWKGSDAGETIKRTGLALLAIGGFEEAALASRKGIAFLRSRQRDSGAIGGGSPESHAIAALALEEAAVRTRDPAATRSAARAVALLAIQNHEGPWGRGGVAAWQYHALRLAVASGDRGLTEVLVRGREGFLERPSPPEALPAQRAASLRAALWTDPVPDPDRWASETAWVLDHAPVPGTEPPHYARNDLEFAYFGSALLAPLAGEAWVRWWSPLRSKLLRTQGADGAWPAGFEPGRDSIEATALSILILETPRRVPRLPD